MFWLLPHPVWQFGPNNWLFGHLPSTGTRQRSAGGHIKPTSGKLQDWNLKMYLPWQLALLARLGGCTGSNNGFLKESWGAKPNLATLGITQPASPLSLPALTLARLSDWLPSEETETWPDRLKLTDMTQLAGGRWSPYPLTICGNIILILWKNLMQPLTCWTYAMHNYVHLDIGKCS